MIADILAGHARWAIEQGDALERLRAIPDESVHCVVTSPPYFRQRDYGVAGQIGLERTIDGFLARLVAVFGEVRRVLRRDGTLWLNVGDSYVTNPGNGRGGETNAGGAPHRSSSDKRGCGLPVKNLIGLPWRLALALQADGWLLRCDVVWHKPNAVPEPTRDRPGRDHEYLFLLARRPRYHYDPDPVRVRTGREADPATYAAAFGSNRGADADRLGKGYRKRSPALIHPLGRGLRSVWSICSEATDDAHFATFPSALVEPCVLAGCPVGGVVLDPFAGSGTTLLVALRHDRRAVGIELNPRYVEIASRRIFLDSPMFNGQGEGPG